MEEIKAKAKQEEDVQEMLEKAKAEALAETEETVAESEPEVKEEGEIDEEAEVEAEHEAETIPGIANTEEIEMVPMSMMAVDGLNPGLLPPPLTPEAMAAHHKEMLMKMISADLKKSNAMIAELKVKIGKR